MTDEKNTNVKESKNDTLAFIIGGLFILGLVFATYNYFSDQYSNRPEDAEETNIIEKIKETLSARTSDSEEEKDGETTGKSAETSVDEKPVVQVGEWVANSYEEGDIKAGTYTVIYGDTLWEIANAVYGDGTMWTLIRDANLSSIDFLPNGQQALIYAGQTLTIPATQS